MTVFPFIPYMIFLAVAYNFYIFGSIECRSVLLSSFFSLFPSFFHNECRSVTDIPKPLKDIVF